MNLKVAKLPLNSIIYDEFAPVYHDSSVVFCSNRKNDVVVSYTTNGNQQLLDLYIVHKKNKNKWTRPEILSKELTTIFHDGPITFSHDLQKAFFSRNNFSEKKLGNSIDINNKLGLYQTTLSNGKWSMIEPFEFNSSEYTITHPSLSSDGQILFFASDKTGGYGGMDIYYCNLQNGKWSEPINLGENVNSETNELFPYIHHSGRLFFSSQRETGLGGLDIYYCSNADGKWSEPILMESPLNSQFDDFSIAIDSSFKKGFFSSNRNGSDDIFSLIIDIEETAKPVIVCDSVVEVFLCYEFFEIRNEEYDTLDLFYEWDFGDGNKSKGIFSEHCYDKPGSYNVTLNIIDSLTGDLFNNEAAYSLDIEGIYGAHITSIDTGVADIEVEFSGKESNLENLKDIEFKWSFNDGSNDYGPVVSHVFNKPGNYRIQLEISGLLESSDEKREICAYKEIVVVDYTNGENVSDILADSEEFPDNQEHANNSNIRSGPHEYLSFKQIKENCNLSITESCFTFFEEGGFDDQLTSIYYEWNFGDGETCKGLEVDHCYTKPGEYNINLNIIDSVTGEMFSNQASFIITVSEPDNIHVFSNDYSYPGVPMEFNGENSNFDDFKITNYTWYFGDGNKSTGAITSHVYDVSGEYIVCLELSGYKDSTDNQMSTCVYKTIVVEDGLNMLAKSDDESEPIILADNTTITYNNKKDLSFNQNLNNNSTTKNSDKSNTESCFTFFEEGGFDDQLTSIYYKWDFGDGTTFIGLEADHCYTNPGVYMVSLNVIDSITGKVFSNEASFEIAVNETKEDVSNDSKEEYEEPVEEILTNSTMEKSYPINEILIENNDYCLLFYDNSSYITDTTNFDYEWDFGDGTKMKGKNAEHCFNNPGQYMIRLIIHDQLTGEIFSQQAIYNLVIN